MFRIFCGPLAIFGKGNLRKPEDFRGIPMFLSWAQKGGEELQPSELTKASIKPRGRAYGDLYKVSGFGLSLWKSNATLSLNLSFVHLIQPPATLIQAMCGFTFVVCMYQVILFDLFGQHCLRMRLLSDSTLWVMRKCVYRWKVAVLHVNYLILMEPQEKLFPHRNLFPMNQSARRQKKTMSGIGGGLRVWPETADRTNLSWL